MTRQPRFCGACGTTLLEGVGYCTKCGAKVSLPETTDTKSPRDREEVGFLWAGLVFSVAIAGAAVETLYNDPRSLAAFVAVLGWFAMWAAIAAWCGWRLAKFYGLVGK